MSTAAPCRETLHEEPLRHNLECKSLLTPSRIPSLDYALNPYLGCTHACAYCYARFMARHTSHGLPWGRFVDSKVNAVAVLQKELVRKAPGTVCLSTATDAYQPVERETGLTRSLLALLSQSEFSVSILTKSDLVRRDADVLKRFGKRRCRVGFSFVSADEEVRAAFEPGASSIASRLDALRDLHGQGIRTWVFLAPVLPFITGRSLRALLEKIAGHADSLLVDRLNVKCGNWEALEAVLRKCDPGLVSKWKHVLRPGNDYHTRNAELAEFCARQGIELGYC